MKEASRLRCLQESDPDDQAENITQQEEPTPAPLSFPGDFQESVERGRVWEVVLIRSGWSNNGVYYAPEALQEAVGLFHGVPIASYKLGPKPDGHLPRNLREARTEAPAGNVVGLATDPRVVPFPGGGVEIRGQFHCTDPQVRATLLAAEAAGAPYPLGLSIDANGVANPGMAEGRQGVICTKLIELLETTMVARPAAGGRVVRLVASTEIEEEESQVNKLRKLWEARLRRLGRDAGFVTALTDRQLCEAVLQEAVGDKAILSLVSEWISAGKTEEAQQLLAKMIEEMDAAEPTMAATMADSIAPVLMESNHVAEAKAELQEARKMRCDMLLDRALTGSKLPEHAQGLVRKRFHGQVFADKELQEAISDLQEAVPCY